MGSSTQHRISTTKIHKHTACSHKIGTVRSLSLGSYRQAHCRFSMDGSGIKQRNIGVLLLNQ